MIILSNLLLGISQVIGMFLQFFTFAIVIRVAMSWVNPDPYNFIVQFVSNCTDPLLRPIQKRLPPLGNLDLSPLVLIAAIMILQQVIVGSLNDLALGMR